jgi:hypothetical protein
VLYSAGLVRQTITAAGGALLVAGAVWRCCCCCRPWQTTAADATHHRVDVDEICTWHSTRWSPPGSPYSHPCFWVMLVSSLKSNDKLTLESSNLRFFWKLSKCKYINKIQIETWYLCDIWCFPFRHVWWFHSDYWEGSNHIEKISQLRSKSTLQCKEFHLCFNSFWFLSVIIIGIIASCDQKFLILNLPQELLWFKTFAWICSSLLALLTMLLLIQTQ